ncbi:hypothetical protein [Qipengyuania sp. MTN3-11]|uniref:hypothetical protein n=1 Tax=Qipengyuania sp. MTN3-11 TaxID=3056557 RepID=UPI0036F315A1
MSTSDARSIIADPNWMALRYERARRAFHFVYLPRKERRAYHLLTHVDLAKVKRAIVPRDAAMAHAPQPVPLHAILHCGLGGSTLLADALDLPGRITVLKEPPLLNDLVGDTVRSGRSDEALLNLSLALLARPFSPKEVVVAKASGPANALLADIATRNHSMRTICQIMPLDRWLATAARKGLAGRLWGRRLLIGLNNGGQVPLELNDSELSAMTDLQMAAMGWLSITHHMHRVRMVRGPKQLLVSRSEALFERPERTVGEVADFLDDRGTSLPPLPPELLSVHAKTREPYSPGQRRGEIEAALTTHGKEIDLLVRWAEETARRLDIPMDLDGQASREPVVA